MEGGMRRVEREGAPRAPGAVITAEAGIHNH